MKARLIGYTQVTEDAFDKHDRPENLLDLISFCARVSNPSNQMNKETSEKLINYLIRHRHWSPFELVNALLEIETTRDIARQLLRHRSFTFQEFSQRYADPSTLGNFMEVRDARLQDTKNRQNSIEVDDEELKSWWREAQEAHIKNTMELYQAAIGKNIAKEQARSILPEGNTVSRLYVNGTIRSWIHYISLRSSNGTQLEHSELARACAKAIHSAFPMIADFTHH